ncbi:phytanoyl-CoA dioxygenase family protein [Sulfurovum mangrovi]|uniref:phytanoyl-CoA dioxygenase family protein n=1 Tax=Sulfurovum mangrovi TaxID=2893889 RepID=UPI001E5FA707|nr:phytanoyl-CoA dioxygenase family protein [Sulfurovum mangrovi]UFH59519.1 phytanoyl-CoA dioxygenase family protein [Sulfurovum mangrovi]UFH60667.1 phytanoyl-CoA dioxygenase family protein [Sulfurovum mangrovi]
MKLTDAQLAQFQNDGFIILRDFADPVQCEAILEVAKVHLKYRVEPIETETGYDAKSKLIRTDVKDYTSRVLGEEGTVRRIRQVYQRDILFKEWMESGKMRPVLQQILDDQVVITTAHHNSIMTKMPHRSTQTRWHQDRRYWRYSDNNLVSIWLALDDEYNENGVLEFIPGSHRMKFDADQFDEKEYFREECEKNIPLIEKKVSTTLKRGDVIIFHSLLLHRANKNETDTPKISFVYTVKGARTKAEEGSRSSEFPEISLPFI